MDENGTCLDELPIKNIKIVTFHIYLGFAPVYFCKKTIRPTVEGFCRYKGSRS